MLIQPKHVPYFRVPKSVAFPGSLLAALKKSRFASDEMRTQTWRRKELLQMLEVTTVGNHAGSRATAEIRHRLVDVFLCQLFPDGLHDDFQLIGHPRLRLEFWYISAWHHGRDNRAGSNLESMGATHSSQ